LPTRRAALPGSLLSHLRSVQYLESQPTRLSPATRPGASPPTSPSLPVAPLSRHNSGFSAPARPYRSGPWPMLVKDSIPAARRFPPPWQIGETDASFIVRDANGQALAYVYFEDEPGRRAAAFSPKTTPVCGFT
jgi:hypothetical protein